MKQAIENHITKLSKTIEGLKKFKTAPTDPTKKKQVLSERFKCNLESENFFSVVDMLFIQEKINIMFNTDFAENFILEP